MSDNWNPNFVSLSALFFSIKSVAQYFTPFTQWPSIRDYQEIFKQKNLMVSPVEQAEKSLKFEEGYEPRIFLKAELQTRTENWHDFFNAMVWLQFTDTKKTLNQLHYHAAIERASGTNRNPLENAITLFDECGCILISDRDDLLELVKEHQWQELFWHNRAKLKLHFSCVVVGHALFEKALNPYIGMTAHAVLISSAKLLKESQQGDFKALDKVIADMWQQNKISISRDLSAFPILGMPDWHKANSEESFYLNKDYFRAKKRHQ